MNPYLFTFSPLAFDGLFTEYLFGNSTWYNGVMGLLIIEAMGAKNHYKLKTNPIIFKEYIVPLDQSIKIPYLDNK